MSFNRLGGNSGSTRDSTLTLASIQKIETIISKTGKITGENNNQEFFFQKILKLRSRARSGLLMLFRMERLYPLHEAPQSDNRIAKAYELAQDSHRSIWWRGYSPETYNRGLAKRSGQGGWKAASTMGRRVAQRKRGHEHCNRRRISEGADNRLLWRRSTLWGENPVQRPHSTGRNGRRLQASNKPLHCGSDILRP